MYTDYLGSVRVVSDPTTWYRNYYPFGEEYEALGTGNEYKFTGKEWDEESDLYYSRPDCVSQAGSPARGTETILD